MCEKLCYEPEKYSPQGADLDSNSHIRQESEEFRHSPAEFFMIMTTFLKGKVRHATLPTILTNEPKATFTH